SLTQLLRQTKVIAANLKLEHVECWVDSELNGYAQDAEPPKYREYSTSSIEYNNPYQGGWRFAGHMNIKIMARQPIAEIEDFSRAEHGVFIPAPINLPLYDISGSPLDFDFPQRLIVMASQYKRIVDGVTNELLKVTTELEKRGIVGENMNFNEREKQNAASIVYNIGTVHGAVGNVSNSPITLYDNKTINHLFVEKNIPKEDRRELEDILDELMNATHAEKQSLLTRAEKLIVRHKEVLGITAEIIVKSVKATLE
ncbi:MAG TPA: hypothetical protein VG347_16775, partial [Verrucomicrobiae bacterium]|nr:hypothetical protein [Verrucomicrobiae bacterium]